MAKKDKTTNEDTTETSVETAPEAVDAPAPSAPEKKQKAKEVDDGLIPMSKDGVTLRVHPTTVHAHKHAGWEL